MPVLSHDMRRFLLLLLVHAAAASSVFAQAGTDSAYQAKRQKAVQMFSEGKRLEALPLLEELVQANPRDDQMLVALAACLVDHAATLSDDLAAGKERMRARDLLDRAWDLGNASPLAMNLSQLLRQLPENGAIQFSDNPQVDQVMRAAEAAFSRRDFAEALKDYAKALELEPKNYSAALFTANTYDKQDAFVPAAEWYDRAIQLDPNIETAYRYWADMLAREGRMADARAMLIHAAVAEPYNRIVWRELHAWAVLNGSRINEVFVAIPVATEALPARGSQPPNIAAAWQAYRAVRANWKDGEAFKKAFPQEKEYRHSLLEESQALAAAASLLEKLRTDKNTAELLASDPSASLLLNLSDAGLLEAYVLFSLGDSGIARDYAAYRSANRAKLEDYLDKFVVPLAHGQATPKSGAGHS